MQPTTWRKSGPRRPRHSGLAGRAAMTIRRKAGTGRVGPCPSWVISRHNGLDRRCPLYPGDLNRSTQHFILKGKDGVSGDKLRISSRFHCGRENGVMGSLEARRVAEGDWAGFWQAVIVDLFFGGTAWWDSSCPAASLQAGVDARGTRGDFQRRYGTSIGTLAR